MHKTVLEKKISILIEELIRSEPPFDAIHMCPSMMTSYGRYTKLYPVLSKEERNELIQLIRGLVKSFIIGSIFRLEDLSGEYRHLISSLRSFFAKYDKEQGGVTISARNEGVVKVSSLLKTQIPIRIPRFKFVKLDFPPGATSFSVHLFKETNLIFSFIRSSHGGSFVMDVSFTKPKIFFPVGNLFGLGGFSAHFNNLEEFENGVEEACKVIEFLFPRLEQLLLLYEEFVG
jgi:hypothetical protein